MNNNPSNPNVNLNQPSSDPVGVNNTPVSKYNLPTFRLGTQTGPCYVATKNSSDKFYCPLCNSVEKGSFRIISHTYDCLYKDRIYCQQPELRREQWLSVGIDPNTGQNMWSETMSNFNGGKRKRKTHRKRKTQRKTRARRHRKKN